ncbi:YdcF family protein [Kroppenstedtia pulmonis]|nr:YdcF family protein [Kroppenstedtia pulmonis]
MEKMDKKKKIAFFIFMTAVILFVILWFLTGKWIRDGELPKADGSAKYAIVFGAKVNGDVPSLSLLYRMEAALEYARRYPDVTLIASGGKGEDEWISEAETIYHYLIKNGISPDRVIREDQSTSTYENIYFSSKFLPEDEGHITLISSDYHLARAQIVANRLGFKTDVVTAETPAIVKAQLFARERIALLYTVLLE